MRQSVNYASHNQVGKGQSVRSQVTGGARRKMGLELIERTDQALSSLVERLRRASQTNKPP